jgi:hypothetical protein
MNNEPEKKEVIMAQHLLGETLENLGQSSQCTTKVKVGISQTYISITT